MIRKRLRAILAKATERNALRSKDPRVFTKTLKPLIRPLKDYPPLWVGLIGAALIGALVLGSLAVGTLGIGDDRYEAEFAHTGGIRSGDEVRVAGMSVGEVTSTKLDGDRVLVSFRTRKSVHLGSATHASIKLATLLGGRYVELQPLGAGDLANDRIGLANTTVPFDLQKVIETGGPAIEKLDGVKLRESLKVLSDDFRGTPQAVGQTLDGLGNCPRSSPSGRTRSVGCFPARTR